MRVAGFSIWLLICTDCLNTYNAYRAFLLERHQCDTVTHGYTWYDVYLDKRCRPTRVHESEATITRLLPISDKFSQRGAMDQLRHILLVYLLILTCDRGKTFQLLEDETAETLLLASNH